MAYTVAEPAGHVNQNVMRTQYVVKHNLVLDGMPIC